MNEIIDSRAKMQVSNFDFKQQVIEASKQIPIVADFWAEWCAPCRTLGPILEHLAEEAKEGWQLVKVNTEEHPQLSAEWGIRGIPAVKMFHEGAVIADFVGALPEVQVRKWLEQHLPSESKKMLEAARTAINDHNEVKARELLTAAISANGDNPEARILLAELIFSDDVEEALSLIETIPEEHPLYARAAAIKTLNRLISEQKRISAQDGDSEAGKAYLAGIESLRSKDFGQAIEYWVEAILLDKTIDDDGPRKACIALFSLLGPDHEITRKHHRAFTSALF